MLLLGAIALVAVWRAQSDREARSSLEHRAVAAASLERARAQLFLSSALAAALVFGEDASVFSGPYDQTREAGREAVEEARMEFIAAGETEGLAALEAVVEQMDALLEEVDAIVGFMATADSDVRLATAQEFMPPLWTTGAVVMTDLQRLAADQQTRLASERAAADTAADRSLALLVALAGGAVAVGALAVATLVLSVVRPLGRLRASVRAIASGHLDARADVSGPVEVASLAADFNAMVTERLRADDALRESETKYRRIFENTQDIYYQADEKGIITEISPSIERYGYTREDLIGTQVLNVYEDPTERSDLLNAVLERGEVGDYEIRLKAADGSVLNASVNTHLLRSPDGSVAGVEGAIRDIGDRKRMEARLLHLANHDQLTGVFNRRRLEDELERELAQAKRYRTPGALLYLDLDQFKDVNDSLGHRAGDELLADLAVLMREQLRETDILARPGGDEFVILLPHTDVAEAQGIAKRLLEAVEHRAFVVSGQPIPLTASIGIAMFPDHEDTVGELLSRADLAMYQAKENGRNGSCVFTHHTDWQTKIESRLGLQNRIREALEKDLLLLYAQPILNLRSGEFSEYELLVRLDLGDSVLPAGDFVGIAERFGLIQSLDRWVVRRAIHLMSELGQADRNLRLAVNLSAMAFKDGEFLPMIQRELEATAVEPARLVLEVTESAAIANINEARRFVRTLKDTGCRFALDDFGVGFSSFYHLKHLPVDFLKIDGSFIRDIVWNSVDQHLVKAIVQAARGLGKQTIAEFVGNEEAVRLLREYGVDYAQGYHLGRPQDVSKVLLGSGRPQRRAA